ncbi:TSUP family transporter [Granulosicoccaceae sp. 1_MG-2023]|nr:TSUP family transporter [Granulosicoccaceae sp. 1_MG-2023]
MFDELSFIQSLLVGLLFVWSAFVRSGLGFGGAALTLPLLLLVHDDPLLFLPVIAVHLLIFSSWTVNRAAGSVNWPYLRRLLLILLIPKLAGVYGLLSLPASAMTAFVYLVTLVYAVSYVLNLHWRGGRRFDLPILCLGGYMSGASLIGAPLIVAVATRQLAPAQLRTTLFVLWFILVAVKMAAFIVAGVDLQLQAALLLLLPAMAGHWLGERLHRRMLAGGQTQLIRWIGGGLIVVSLVGLGRLMTDYLL